MSKIAVFHVLFLITLIPSLTVAAAEYRCADKIISVGDSSAELYLKCGEPDWKQSNNEEVVTRDVYDEKHKTIITVEEWTYNLGPDRFTRIFAIRDGRVTDVRSGGYGSTREEAEKPECGGRIISQGDAAAEVIRYCGRPAWSERHEEIVKERIDEDTVRKIRVTVEDWTYNFGPNRFMRIFTLRNGVVTDIRTGGYGN